MNLSEFLRDAADRPHLQHRQLMLDSATEIDRLDADARAAHEKNERLRLAILDIDAHATPMGVLREDDPEGSPAYYYLTVGALHRALGITGAAAKCVDLPCPRSAWLMESATAMRAIIERLALHVASGTESSLVDFIADAMQAATEFDIVVRDWQVRP